MVIFGLIQLPIESTSLYNRDKFSNDITVEITFEQMRNPVREIFRNHKKTLPPDNFSEYSYFNVALLTRFHHIWEEEQFSCNSTWFDTLLKTLQYDFLVCSYKWHNTKNKNPNLTILACHENCTYLPKILALYKEHFEESCFKSVDFKKKIRWTVRINLCSISLLFCNV